MEDKPVIDFSTSVAPGEKKTVAHTFDTDGYITHFHARAYPGEETDVERSVLLWQGGKDNGNPIPIIRSPEGANDTLVGDEQTWDFEMRRAFDADDTLEVVYRNNGSYTHPVSTVIAVDEARNIFEKLGGIL